MSDSVWRQRAWRELQQARQRSMEAGLVADASTTSSPKSAAFSQQSSQESLYSASSACTSCGSSRTSSPSDEDSYTTTSGSVSPDPRDSIQFEDVADGDSDAPPSVTFSLRSSVWQDTTDSDGFVTGGRSTARSNFSFDSCDDDDDDDDDGNDGNDGDDGNDDGAEGRQSDLEKTLTAADYERIRSVGQSRRMRKARAAAGAADTAGTRAPTSAPASSSSSSIAAVTPTPTARTPTSASSTAVAAATTRATPSGMHMNSSAGFSSDNVNDDHHHDDDDDDDDDDDGTSTRTCLGLSWHNDMDTISYRLDALGDTVCRSPDALCVCVCVCVCVCALLLASSRFLPAMHLTNLFPPLPQFFSFSLLGNSECPWMTLCKLFRRSTKTHRVFSARTLSPTAISRCVVCGAACQGGRGRVRPCVCVCACVCVRVRVCVCVCVHARVCVCMMSNVQRAVTVSSPPPHVMQCRLPSAPWTARERDECPVTA